ANPQSTACAAGCGVRRGRAHRYRAAGSCRDRKKGRSRKGPSAQRSRARRETDTPLASTPPARREVLSALKSATASNWYRRRWRWRGGGEFWRVLAGAGAATADPPPWEA